jgi:subtilisin family serine protease
VGTSENSSSVDSVLSEVASGFKIFSRYTYGSALSGAAVTVAESDLESFSSSADTVDEVSWFEPDPDDEVGSDATTSSAGTSQEISWSMGDVGADSSWTVSGDGQGQVTGVDLYVLDTGASHDDLNVTECLELSKGSLEPCTDLSDLNGHGTEVAGVAAAIDDTTGAVGVAPGVNLHAVQVLNSGGKIVLGRLLAVVDYITEQKKADPSRPIVVNMSLGSDVNTTNYNGLDQAIQASIAAGVVYVFAAGNSGIDAETVTPAHVTEGLTVGAYDQNRQFSSFSNYGSVVDLSAPGEGVLTLTPDNSITEVIGTSVAAPHVAGAVALLLSKDPSLTPAEVHDMIVSSAETGIAGVPTGTSDKRLSIGQ